MAGEWYIWPESKAPNYSIRLRATGNLKRIVRALDVWCARQRIVREQAVVLVPATYHPHFLRTVRRVRARYGVKADEYLRGLTVGKVYRARARMAAFFRMSDVLAGRTPVSPRVEIWTGEESRRGKRNAKDPGR